MNTILGISLYPGLDNTPGENRRLLHEAAALGFRRVFTSLQIPETRADVLRREVRSLFGEAAASAWTSSPMSPPRPAVFSASRKSRPPGCKRPG